MNPGTLPPVSTPERSFPAAVEEVLHRGLARDREDRYPTVTEFVDALEAALGPAAAGSDDPAVADRRPRPDPARSAPHCAARLGRAARAEPCHGAGAGGSRC